LLNPRSEWVELLHKLCVQGQRFPAVADDAGSAGFADWVELLQWLLPVPRFAGDGRERLKDFQLMLMMLALRFAAPATECVKLLKLLVESG